MSEFIGFCPKCRQQILCDTAYISKRIACPVCLQEIAMPEPPKQAAPPAPTPATLPPQSSPAATGGKRNMPMVAVGVGAAVLVLATAAVIFSSHRNGSKAGVPVATTPSANQPAAQNSGPDAPQAMWTFDQDHDRTAIDTSGNGHNARLVGDDATVTKDAKVGSGALSLTGSGYAETDGPVIDTTRSFTVTAWVNLSSLDKRMHCQTVVSMDGTEVSGFYLQLNNAARGRFVFNRLESDDSSAQTVMAAATSVPSTNTWYHLAGVYDADAQTLALYVNGKFQQSVSYTTPWRATGKTAIGRGLYKHGVVDFLDGAIDDVRIYNTALTAAQIRNLASG